MSVDISKYRAGAWVVKQDWSSTKTWAWTPATAEMGANTVRVKVRKATGGTSVETFLVYSVQ